MLCVKFCPIFALFFPSLQQNVINSQSEMLHASQHITKSHFSIVVKRCFEENTFVCIMKSYRKGLIFQQVSAQFNVSVLKKKYYCPGVSYFTFLDKLISYHGENIEIFFRVDHVVVRHSFTKEITVYLLTSHLTRKCAAFLHD